MAHFDFKVADKAAQPVLALRVRSRVEDLPQLIGRSYGQIMQYLVELGESPAGPPYTAYHNLDMQNLDVEIGFPVAKALAARGELKPGEIPAGKQVSCFYKGPYRLMEPAYDALKKFAAERGLTPSRVCYEIYMNGPETPEEELLTQIVFPTG